MSNALRKLWARWRPLLGFSGSRDYWLQRYQRGGDSGAGSGGSSAKYKADMLNAFVRHFGIQTVVEFGCGDGRQLALAQYPQYAGYDISPEAVELCRKSFASDTSKRFALVAAFDGSRSDLALSLDVLFHLVEDKVYFEYLDRLFGAATRFVAIYASDEESSSYNLPHVRHRSVSRDVAQRFDQFQPLDFSTTNASPPEASPAMRFMIYRRQTP
jgi:SAM-dependent methyltransferase